jgi:hypothetical protein
VAAVALFMIVFGSAQPPLRSPQTARRLFAVAIRRSGIRRSDKFQPELTTDSHSRSLKSVQCNTRVGGIEQTIKRSTAGLHTDGHRRLCQAILLHCGSDLIGEDPFDGLFLTLFQNALFGQKTIKR